LACPLVLKVLPQRDCCQRKDKESPFQRKDKAGLLASPLVLIV
jgi:hypothetical protein